MVWRRKKIQKQYIVPEGTRVYAIGDIHGCCEALEKMHTLIAKDMEKSTVRRKVVIYIGDYIDRGVHSKEVVDVLLEKPIPGCERIFLKGNHEHVMMLFLMDPKIGEHWLFWGGDATIQSYGVSLYGENGKRKDMVTLNKDFYHALPESHKKFYQQLQLYHVEGDYLFVHAGIKPGVPLTKQKEDDMLMIREDFYLFPKAGEQCVVFGHTIFKSPFCQYGKIGIDTGTFASGVLTAAVLEGDAVSFLQTVSS